MSNHEHPCRGCGEDLRKRGVTHEANCLASRLHDAQLDLESRQGRIVATENAYRDSERDRERVVNENADLRSRLHRGLDIIHALFGAPNDSEAWRDAAKFEAECRVVEKPLPYSQGCKCPCPDDCKREGECLRSLGVHV